MVPSFIKLISFAKFSDEIGLSVISILLSFNKANSSPVIQFVASFTSDFVETSSKNYEVSISDTRIFAS